jgi:hypothetical protein
MPEPRSLHIINNIVHIHDVIHTCPLPLVKKILTQYLNFPPAHKCQMYVGDIKLSYNDITVYITDNSASWFEEEVKNVIKS